MAADVKATDADNGGEITLEGVTICPGVGIGRAHVLDPEMFVVREAIEPDHVLAEQQRYTRAVEAVGKQLREHVESVHGVTFHDAGVILRAHKAMLADEEFHDGVRRLIETGHKNAEWALEEQGEQQIRRFEAMRDPYFQALAEDVRDMVDSVLAALSRKGETHRAPVPSLRESPVLICGHLYPSAVMRAQRSGAAGFATESRALSAHGAILLKGFGIPAVGDVHGLRGTASDGDQVVVDATNGLVVFRPRETVLEKYIVLQKKLKLPGPAPPPTVSVTRDGTRVRLLANIENPDQVGMAFQKGLEGIGLFRTEFFVLTSGRFPDEEEQYSIYRKVINASEGRRVVIRTFDIGGDKQGTSLHRCTGQNPALGVRGIRRHLLRNPEELRTQIRAILRAAEGGVVGMLFPMVTTVDDIRETRRLVQSAKEELRTQGLLFSENVMSGAMVEIPAAAIAVREILSEVHFVSIGTNDLLQYFMAADRDNEDVLQYNDVKNGAFLWLLRFIIGKATEMGRAEDVTVCGEIASRPNLVSELLRLGYRSFSVSPSAAEQVRAAVSNTVIGSLTSDQAFS